MTEFVQDAYLTILKIQIAKETFNGNGKEKFFL